MTRTFSKIFLSMYENWKSQILIKFKTSIYVRNIPVWKKRCNKVGKICIHSKAVILVTEKNVACRLFVFVLLKRCFVKKDPIFKNGSNGSKLCLCSLNSRAFSWVLWSLKLISLLVFASFRPYLNLLSSS